MIHIGCRTWYNTCEKISDIRRERVELYVYISMIFNIAMSIVKFLAYILIIICAVKYLKKQE